MTLEGGGVTILRNVRNRSPIDAVSHPGRLHSSSTPLREPNISHKVPNRFLSWDLMKLENSLSTQNVECLLLKHVVNIVTVLYAVMFLNSMFMNLWREGVGQVWVAVFMAEDMCQIIAVSAIHLDCLRYISTLCDTTRLRYISTVCNTPRLSAINLDCLRHISTLCDTPRLSTICLDCLRYLDSVQYTSTVCDTSWLSAMYLDCDIYRLSAIHLDCLRYTSTVCDVSRLSAIHLDCLPYISTVCNISRLCAIHLDCLLYISIVCGYTSTICLLSTAPFCSVHKWLIPSTRALFLVVCYGQDCNCLVTWTGRQEYVRGH